jgi:phage tail-like protein
MARSVATDFLHSMRFQVSTVDGSRPTLNAPGDALAERVEAGFTQVTTPEATCEAVEYREGTFVYTRKFPGVPTMNDISCSRGVTRLDSSFWNWLKLIIEGGGEYRQDLLMRHYHRANALTNMTSIDLTKPARIYHVKEAFPTRHKVAGDFDATASEVSIMELDLAYERFEVEEVATV